MTKRFAFFDVDETIVRFKTMFECQRYWLTQSGFMPTIFGAWRHRRFSTQMEMYLRSGRSREFINAAYYRDFGGRDPALVRKLARRWYEDMRATGRELYFTPILSVLRAQQAAGIAVVLVSGSLIDILTSFAEELNVNHILATELQVVDRRYTGRILPPQMIGAGKATAVRSSLAEQCADRAECWAYGDHTSDLAMLEEVGHPTIVSNAQEMIIIAEDRGWDWINPFGQIVSRQHQFV